jgi:hypothetical protein
MIYSPCKQHRRKRKPVGKDIIFSTPSKRNLNKTSNNELNYNNDNNNIVQFNSLTMYNYGNNVDNNGNSDIENNNYTDDKNNTTTNNYNLTALDEYFKALDNNHNSSIYLTCDRWILLRAHCRNQSHKLSYSQYWIINCQDVEMKSLHCNCKSFECIHICYIKANLTKIKFPKDRGFNIQQYTSNNCNNKIFYDVQIVREIDDGNSLMRRILIVNQHNQHPPIIVIQNNQLPLCDSFWCRHCLNSSCTHINAAIHYCESNQLKLTQFKSKRSNRTFHNSISKQTISKPKYLHEYDNIMNNNLSNTYKQPRILTPNSVLHEKKTLCKNTNCSHTNYTISTPRSCCVYTKECKYDCLVSSIECKECGQITEYDGLNDGIFNYNNKLLFTHSLLNFYTISFSATSYPFNAFVLTMNRIYKENSLNYSFVSNPTWLVVWCSFVKLQDWTYEFQCPQCGPNPDMLFCDGTSVSIQRLYAKDLRTPINVDSNLPIRSNTYLSPYQTTCYPNEIKEIIKSFIQNAKENKYIQLQIIINDFANQIQNNQYNQYNINLIKSLHSFLCLISLQLNMINNNTLLINQNNSVNSNTNEEQQYLSYTPLHTHNVRLKYCLRLLTILSAEYESLVALISPLVLESYNEMINYIRSKQSIPLDISQSFKNIRPILYDLLNAFDLFQIKANHLNSDLILLTDTIGVVNFIDSIMDKANEIHNKYNELQKVVEPRIVPNKDENVLNDLQMYQKDSNLTSVGKFYSTRPTYCKIQHYSTVDNNITRSLNNNNPNVCQKKFDSSNKYSGGIMVFWCEHGISYGFHMIQKSEALRDVMCAILMHWKTAPKYIVYDNACHLMKYCHNREWDYFKNTTFLIDEFHQYNHTACTEAHSMKQYKVSRSVKFLFKNSSVSESGNAGLVKIKPSMYYMQADAAFLYPLVQLEIQNNVKCAQLNRNISTKSYNIHKIMNENKENNNCVQQSIIDREDDSSSIEEDDDMSQEDEDLNI